MRIAITSTDALGQVIRTVRKHSHIRLDDLAATAGVSKQFTSDVEHGKPTMQLGLVFKLLAELGIVLELDIPEDAARTLAGRHTSGESGAPPAGPPARPKKHP